MSRNKVLEYHNIDITIGSRDGNQYPVTVHESVCGEDSGILRLPYSSYEEFRRTVETVYIIIQNSQYRWPPKQDEQFIQQFGQKLFESLISDKIQSLYARCRERANINKKGLRLRLHIKDPELSIVPWEYLYDSSKGDYISFYSKSPIVRYIDLPQSIEPPRVRLPLRILCMISSPIELPSLDAQKEKVLMQEALKPLIDSGKIQVEWLDNRETYEMLQSRLRTEVWHVFHFIGHGGSDAQTGEGLLYLCDSLGLFHEINAAKLARLLDHQCDTLKLVFLNACGSAKANDKDIFSSIVGGLMQNGALSVVAMQQKITDGAAIRFSESFYRSIADGMPIDTSVSEARTAMNGGAGQKNTLEWGIPVLYMRAPDGMLFKLPSKPSQPRVTKEKEVSDDPGSYSNINKRNVIKNKNSKRKSRNNVYESNSFNSTRSIGLVLQNNLNINKFKRYDRGIKPLGFFFFFTCDVVLVSLGTCNQIRFLPPVASIAIVLLFLILLLAIFIWNAMNRHTYIGFAISLMFGAIWCGLGTIYFPDFAYHNLVFLVLACIFFSFLRFQLFKP